MLNKRQGFENLMTLFLNPFSPLSWYKIRENKRNVNKERSNNREREREREREKG